jgi:hypothetical protein
VYIYKQLYVCTAHKTTGNCVSYGVHLFPTDFISLYLLAFPRGVVNKNYDGGKILDFFCYFP